MSAVLCTLSLALTIVLLVIPWSNDEGERTYWDRMEGPLEDDRRVSRDVWSTAGDDLASAFAAIGLLAALAILFPTTLLLVSATQRPHSAWRLRSAAFTGGLLLFVSAVAWSLGDWRTFGAGPCIAVGAGFLALLAGPPTVLEAGNPDRPA